MDNILIKHNDNRLDIMRGIAILFVVAGHFIQYSVVGGGIQNPDYLWIYKFHMEVFFFCSGFLFHGLDLEHGLSTVFQLIRKKVIRLVIPYIFWSFVVLYLSESSIGFDNLVDYFWLSPRLGLWYLKTLTKFCLITVVVFTLWNFIKARYRHKLEPFLLCLLSALAICLHDWHFLFFILGISVNRIERFILFLSNHLVVLFSSLIFILSTFISSIPSYITASSAIAYFYALGETVRKLRLEPAFTQAIGTKL